MLASKRPRDERQPKRSSTRAVVVSKSMRFVDFETRKEVRDKRLQALEADNYTEENDLGQDDGAYADSDSEKPLAKRKKAKSKGKGCLIEKWASYRVKSLDIIMEEQTNLLSSNRTSTPNMVSVTASQSCQPPRHFCSVCGLLGKYTCTRCGLRFCCSRCNEHHKETRCLTFSM